MSDEKKPFNLKNTYLYTIVDLHDNERGPENLIFGHDYDLLDQDDAKLLLNDFQLDKLKLSPRRSVALDIENNKE